MISYLDKLVQPSYLLCTQFILAFLLNYLTLLSSFCLFFLAFASLAISLSITKVPEWQLPQQVWLSHFLSFEKCLVLSFVWDWARSVSILSARPQPQTCKTIIIFKICSQDVNNNIPVLIKHNFNHCAMAGLSVIVYIKTVPIQMSSISCPTFVFCFQFYRREALHHNWPHLFSITSVS